MSGRRRMPEPVSTPVGGGNDPYLAPPQAMPNLNPTEVPAPPPGPGQEEQGPAIEEMTPDAERVELSPEEQLTFASLLTCGQRSKTLHILDHTVVVHSLSAADDLRVGVYAKPYAGTVGEQRAYQIAVAAAGLRSIDGQPVINSLYEKADEAALFDQKVKMVEKMYPTVVNRIYKGVLESEVEFVDLVARLGKSFG